MKRGIFWSLFYCFLFKTADLRSYCGYFLAICQLCLFVFRNISVDSEGYSVRPPDDYTGAGGGGVGGAGGNNRESAASFYSSSDEDSDDDNGGGGTKFNSSLGSNLKFSIRYLIRREIEIDSNFIVLKKCVPSKRKLS